VKCTIRIWTTRRANWALSVVNFDSTTCRRSRIGTLPFELLNVKIWRLVAAFLVDAFSLFLALFDDFCRIKIKKQKEKRIVYHCHFSNWPDFGEPDYPTTFLHFLSECEHLNIFNKSQCGPSVIHCSAGVGRSGTFILVDSMLQLVIFRKLWPLPCRLYIPFCQISFICSICWEINSKNTIPFQDSRLDLISRF
jgi:hypothetical protein